MTVGNGERVMMLTRKLEKGFFNVSYLFIDVYFLYLKHVFSVGGKSEGTQCGWRE